MSSTDGNALGLAIKADLDAHRATYKAGQPIDPLAYLSALGHAIVSAAAVAKIRLMSADPAAPAVGDIWMRSDL